MDSITLLISCFAVLISGAVAVATFVYAALTWKLVSETKMMREVQTEPKVSVVSEFDPADLDRVFMVIQNIGLGPAYEVKLQVHPDFVYFEPKMMPFSEFGVIRDGLSFMAPGQRVSIFLFSMARDFEKRLSGSTIEVTTTYRNSIGKLYQDNYSIDLSKFVGMIYRKPGTLKDIAHKLETIERSVTRLTSELQTLSVVVEDREGYLERLADQRQRHRELMEAIKAKTTSESHDAAEPAYE
jgi:hypothetical protein